MEVKVKTDVTAEPLSLGVIKNYLKFDDTNIDEVALINTMVKAAREACEKYTGLSFAEKTLYAYFTPDDLNDMIIDLPYGPIKSRSDISMKWIDQEGTETSMTVNTDFWIRGLNNTEIEVSTVWTTVGVSNTTCDYRAEYICGYGISGYTEALPSGLLLAMAKQVAEWFENREDWMPSLSSSVKKMLDPLCVNMFL